jgi:hypothetical protein
MEAWALAQEMSPVEVLTDEGGGTVEIAEVKRAIRNIVESDTTEQLVVYFAGHGVNISFTERWLLSDAPSDSNAAVNVFSSAMLAGQSGIPHVVFISDACRTAAEGVRAQNVSGSEIFPNDGAGGLEVPVDLFYACLLGAVANEVRDATMTAGSYTALYTGALLDALDGKRPDLVEWLDTGSGGFGYVRPRPLKRHLHDELTRRLQRMSLATHVVQVPDAHIASDETAWISRFVDGGARKGSRRRRDGDRSPQTPLTVATSLVTSAFESDAAGLEVALEAVRAEVAPETAALARSIAARRTPEAPFHFETMCGFKVAGARVVDAFSPVVDTEVFDSGRLVRAQPPWPGASVLLTFEPGWGALLPAVPEFIATLTIEGDELVDVAYEPSDNTWRWGPYSQVARELRSLRAVAAAAARNGVFRLEGADAETVARRMQSVKGVDPTLGIYAAYAYQDLGLRDRIRRMAGYMNDDLGAVLFDVALLARRLDGTTTGTSREVLSLFPLLSQGWALLRALRVELPGELAGLERTLVPSLWTLLDASGVDQVRAALHRRPVG